MSGFEAYKTYLGMCLHYQGHINGWDYNFAGRCKEETYKKKKQLIHQYAKIERTHPTKVEQIKFFYPAFKQFGYVKPEATLLFTRKHHDFMVLMGNPDLLVRKHGEWIKEMLDEGFIKDFFDLFDVSEMLPKFYQLYNNKVMTHDQAVILCMVIPELLNTIVSQEPIVFETWKAKLQFDKQFFSLYISQPVLNQLKDATVVAFQTK